MKKILNYLLSILILLPTFSYADFGTGAFSDGSGFSTSLCNTPNNPACLDSSGNLVGTIIGRQETHTALNGIVLANGELATTSDSLQLRVGNGVVSGGKVLATATPNTVYLPQGRTIQQTIDAITDESASNQYEVVLPPTTFTENITQPPYVHLRGSGKGLTIIQSNNSSPALIFGSNTNVSDLSINAASGFSGSLIKITGNTNNVKWNNVAVGSFVLNNPDTDRLLTVNHSGTNYDLTFAYFTDCDFLASDYDNPVFLKGSPITFIRTTFNVQSSTELDGNIAAITSAPSASANIILYDSDLFVAASGSFSGTDNVSCVDFASQTSSTGTLTAYRSRFSCQDTSGNNNSVGILTNTSDNVTVYNSIFDVAGGGTNFDFSNSGGTVNVFGSVYEETSGTIGGKEREVHASGTVYTLTATPALVDFGTTDPSISLSAGVWSIRARAKIKLNATTFAANRDITMKLRNTTASADVASTSTVDTVPVIAVAVTQTYGNVITPEVTVNISSTSTIQLWGSISALPGEGSVTITEADIYAVRIR